VGKSKEVRLETPLDYDNDEKSKNEKSLVFPLTLLTSPKKDEDEGEGAMRF